MPYNHKQIEQKWRQKWQDSKVFETHESPDKPKFYALDMFPYPSGAGLHVGHPKGYIATDIIARMKMMQGFNVLHPMGWDAFGLPAENFAIKNKVHPSIATAQNVETFKKQLSILGFTYDWEREVNTTDPKYYKWTQWAFLQMFKKGLAFESNEPVNWCPTCKTVLANEDLEGGNCERCGSAIEHRPLRQWVLRITDYAERLLNDLDKLPDWPESIKLMQKEWIGKSEGAVVKFYLSPHPSSKGRGSEGGEIPGYFTTDRQLWKLLHGRSLEMRKNPTKAEEVMWEILRRDALNFHFRRQQIIGGFIVDFVCLEKKLVIEVDGDIHDYQQEEDKNRTEFLNERGFKVIRFKNHEVLNDSSSVINEITEQLKILPLGEDLGGVKTLPFGEGQGGVEVFTTRPDTLFGATYMVLAPEHPLVSQITTDDHRAEVEAYIAAAKAKSEIERGDDTKEKTGVFTGAYAVNPVNDEEIPIWVADYVLWGYGTGAIMAVPAHDGRDHAFARKYNIPEQIVVEPITGEPKENEEYRQSIVAVVRNPKTNEFLSINWGSELGGNLFIGGGRDSGEDPIECARREIAEEAGYKNLRFVSQTETIHHHYFAFSKNKQRNIDCVGLYFELENEERNEASLEEDEKNKFKVEWLSAEDADKKVVEKLHELVFDRLVKDECYVGDGLATNSDFLNGLPTWKAKADMISWLEENGFGARKIQYKLRDWVFSRQRYWGEPIPLVHCEKCGVVPIPESELPLELPPVEHYEPTDTGESPLANISDWVNTTCPECGGPARRETNTMPQWAGSCWYYLRYEDPKNDSALVAFEKEKYWSPIDLYVGGAEHATRHLIYARFWHKFLFDIGAVHYEEPFTRLQNVGLIMAEDGRKMSKRWDNVVNPDDVVEEYGADALRVYEMFMGPFNQPAAWSTNGLVGARRFLEKVYNYVLDWIGSNQHQDDLGELIEPHVKKVTEDIDNFRFNTAVASLMSLFNELNEKVVFEVDKERKRFILDEQMKRVLCLLCPFAPHLVNELWELIGEKGFVEEQQWPEVQEELLIKSVVTIAVQVNGKLRGTIEVSPEAEEDEVKTAALGEDNVKKFIDGKEIQKVIFVKGKLLNIVAS